MKSYIFLLTFALFLASCDRENYIHYTVENNTGDSLKLTFTFAENYFDDRPADTAIVLKSNQKDTIFIFTQISPSVYDPEDGDRMIYIVNVDMMRFRDSVRIKKDMSLRKNWTYIETGKNSAKIEFTANESDF